MHYLLADETNVKPSTEKGIKFFVYGGLVIPDTAVGAIDEKVRSVRKEKEYKNTDSLKFDSHTRPENISVEDFGLIKNELIKFAIEVGCTSLFYVVHHEIAKNQGLETTTKWGADHVVSKFNKLLAINDDIGMVIMDRLPDASEYGFLVEKFSTGLIYQDKIVPLERIKLFSASCDNASHLASLADIILGSFRYCINNPANFDAAKTMMGNLVQLIWSDKKDDKLYPFEKGLTFRPVPDKIDIQEYKQDYDELLSQINSLLE